MKYFVQEINANYKRLMDDVYNSSSKAGRDFSSIKTILVTKYQPVEKINAAIHAGGTHYAENYPEMLIPKLDGIIEMPGLKWHMIGHIQSRKSGLVVEHFDYVHSVDSLRIAQRLNSKAMETGKKLPVLIEINSGQEASKYGFNVAEKDGFSKFLDILVEVSNYEGLVLNGFMTMPPITEHAEDSRNYFSALNNLMARVNEKLPHLGLSELSMGTSQDYQVAIEEGATYIRIGTKVFGEREK